MPSFPVDHSTFSTIQEIGLFLSQNQRWVLTLTSHFLWVAVLHTKKNEGKEGGMKESKTKVLEYCHRCTVQLFILTRKN